MAFRSVMNDVVQQNSSISEETAAASEELSGQSTELQNMMRRFKTIALDNSSHLDVIVSDSSKRSEKFLDAQTNLHEKTGSLSSKLIAFDEE
ncbi:MAG: hypothetical protein HN745_15770 [Deltaproteobacteria bacterium]|jgi:hypothetical protein|nr:hypothetical protein [Deltaproteobacteria bacterium]MBT4641246.1 hypothetical protein [Deltaproteobacteria bacterium]MBT7713180.1 hypothetical protein [Deltaproteobacteria bacterium]